MFWTFILKKICLRYTSLCEVLLNIDLDASEESCKSKVGVLSEVSLFLALLRTSAIV